LGVCPLTTTQKNQRKRVDRRKHPLKRTEGASGTISKENRFVTSNFRKTPEKKRTHRPGCVKLSRGKGKTPKKKGRTVRSSGLRSCMVERKREKSEPPLRSGREPK